LTGKPDFQIVGPISPPEKRAGGGRRPGRASLRRHAALAYWDVFGIAKPPKYFGAGAPDLWWSVAKSSAAQRTGEIADDRLSRPRILLMVPTLLGILFVSFIVVQFAAGGPVERVIAQLSGADTGASSRISGSRGATSARAISRRRQRRGQFEVPRRAGAGSRIPSRA